LVNLPHLKGEILAQIQGTDHMTCLLLDILEAGMILLITALREKQGMILLITVLPDKEDMILLT
jgi:hypothetical protein